ncbi:RWD domain containing protein [Babesia bovis T2Bo]|uniref:RWD domain containing protein n=1 Tax=Babesia bovis TaxID=5865 RepID=A7ATS7_BABBO|nr:RWD domain containing protein [Babesia bovis T2Bo]EDO06338.1 RWD domain containing protein [Babesia bovis T2Bo]|eukprot:XP_001609906.1 RWD domain containing protein [Babesia bovis T2Bo]
MDDSERAMEIDALSAIFMEGEELQIINENEIVITCDPRGHDESHSCSMIIKFTLPDGYPGEDSPQYKVIDAVRVSDEDMETIVGIIEDVIEQNRGMPVLYTIIEAVNEHLAICAQRSEQSEANSVQTADDDTSANVDTGLQIKQLCPETERVTKEMFEEWSAKFRLEMIQKGVWRDIDAASSKGQMTGKEIFEAKPENIDLGENGNVFWNNEALYEDDIDVEALE